jgi:hypothetical protein
MRSVRSRLTATPGASRLDRHGDAGLSHVGRPQCRASSQVADARVQFVLAEEAAAAVVPQIIRIGKLLGSDHLVADADEVREAARVGQLGAGDARAVGRHGDGAIAEGEMGGLRHNGAINAAGEGDGAAVEAAQDLQKAITAGRQVGRRSGGHGVSRGVGSTS